MWLSSLCRLEGLVKEYKQALRANEAERELLLKEKSTLIHGNNNVTPQKTTPIRCSTPDTPSKDIVLDSEPHGEEFQYFKNVLFEYMMGRQTQQLSKVVSELARFSESQKKQLTARSAYFS